VRPISAKPQKAKHYRRCNGCEDVLMDFAKEPHCGRCGKFMAPFFYFDEAKLHFTDNLERPYYPIPLGAYGPLIGLSAQWPEE